MMSKKKKILTCKRGDTVIVNGKKHTVAEIICGGHERCNSSAGERAYISVHRIMPGGQVLKNTSICVDQKWKHLT